MSQLKNINTIASVKTIIMKLGNEKLLIIFETPQKFQYCGESLLFVISFDSYIVTYGLLKCSLQVFINIVLSISSNYTLKFMFFSVVR